jgi:hypothetical protein
MGKTIQRAYRDLESIFGGMVPMRTKTSRWRSRETQGCIGRSTVRTKMEAIPLISQL